MKSKARKNCYDGSVAMVIKSLLFLFYRNEIITNHKEERLYV